MGVIPSKPTHRFPVRHACGGIIFCGEEMADMSAHSGSRSRSRAESSSDENIWCISHHKTAEDDYFVYARNGEEVQINYCNDAKSVPNRIILRRVDGSSAVHPKCVFDTVGLHVHNKLLMGMFIESCRLLVIVSKDTERECPVKNACRQIIEYVIDTELMKTKSRDLAVLFELNNLVIKSIPAKDTNNSIFVWIMQYCQALKTALLRLKKG
jgi:hypothetical protein